ncbi:winged helix-turn-helix transcriptional regulator [Virgibacillus doumboii]|uniref:winged helix-turn-helix transcriptional regulator n=1 Tax=Virgibacillus doumboii TaxID=2697503 RepID=UPI0013E06E14|nr:helix-turn-helix domain-containing protein [Virgibacillus doumboii]
MQTCPYIEASFQILGKKWNGQIIHYLSSCENQTAHFSDMKRDLKGITARALSMKLSELTDEGLVEKKVESGSTVTISYVLSEKGTDLADSLKPIQEWAKRNMDVEIPNKKEAK